MTVNPTRNATGAVVPPPPHGTLEERPAFVTEYMPIKFGSTLTSRLAKRYWERPSALNKPLLFAIEDFSAPSSMIHTRSGLPIYLYGYNWESERGSAGRLQITPRKVATHRWGGKEIPSGFFDLPGTENISAVLFSNSGTIAKFNRLGVLAGFGSKRVVVFRSGFEYDPDPDAAKPRAFRRVVGAPGYSETWAEGLDVFHNPKAKHPVDLLMLPAAAHHRLLDDGRLDSLVPTGHPVGSMTHILVAATEDEAQRLMDKVAAGGDTVLGE